MSVNLLKRRTVEIPADVKDNSRHAVRIQWRSTRPVTLKEIEQDRQYANVYGYTVHEWDDVDRNENRVTLVRMVNKSGHTAELFEISYFTRVACERGPWCYSYASHYTVVTTGDGEASDTVPYCDEHTAELRRHVNDVPSLTLHLSERLRVGQH